MWSNINMIFGIQYGINQSIFLSVLDGILVLTASSSPTQTALTITRIPPIMVRLVGRFLFTKACNKKVTMISLDRIIVKMVGDR